MNWVGSFTIDELLDNVLDPAHPRPPEGNGAYLVSRRSWTKHPTRDCEPLYSGGNTGTSQRFRTRVGDLIADMFGLFGGPKGHHSGGQSLYRYCIEHQIHPKQLHIGWFGDCACKRCAENVIFEQFRPQLNKIQPPRCSVHLVNIYSESAFL